MSRGSVRRSMLPVATAAVLVLTSAQVAGASTAQAVEVTRPATGGQPNPQATPDSHTRVLPEHGDWARLPTNTLLPTTVCFDNTDNDGYAEGRLDDDTAPEPRYYELVMSRSETKCVTRFFAGRSVKASNIGYRPLTVTSLAS